MSSGIVWREPELNSKGKVKRQSMAELVERALRSHPQKWALVCETKKQSTINPRFRGAQYERAYRIVSINGERVYRIYARYIGAEA